MKLTRVTFTGIDESTKISDLLQITMGFVTENAENSVFRKSPPNFVSTNRGIKVAARPSYPNP